MHSPHLDGNDMYKYFAHFKFSILITAFIFHRFLIASQASKIIEKATNYHLKFVNGGNFRQPSSLTMYSRSMKGSLIATISTFLEWKAARVTRRPMRPNLQSKQCFFLVWPLDGAVTPCNPDQSHWIMWSLMSQIYSEMKLQVEMISENQS